MEKIITLKVDLEYPEEAHHAIDEATKVYEADMLKWTEAEIMGAQHLWYELRPLQYFTCTRKGEGS